jgi:hypothetical protein
METQGTPTFIPTHPHTETQCSMLPHANTAMVQLMDTKKGNGEGTQVVCCMGIGKPVGNWWVFPRVWVCTNILTQQKLIPVTLGMGTSHLTVTHMFGNHLMTQTLPQLCNHYYHIRMSTSHVCFPLAPTPSHHFTPKPNMTMTCHPPPHDHPQRHSCLCC